MESGAITDEAMSDKRKEILPTDMDAKPQFARANLPVTDFPYGWMSNMNTEYLQVSTQATHP